jgi:hypothetical protein
MPQFSVTYKKIEVAYAHHDKYRTLCVTTWMHGNESLLQHTVSKTGVRLQYRVVPILLVVTANTLQTIVDVSMVHSHTNTDTSNATNLTLNIISSTSTECRFSKSHTRCTSMLVLHKYTCLNAVPELFSYCL